MISVSLCQYIITSLYHHRLMVSHRRIMIMSLVSRCAEPHPAALCRIRLGLVVQCRTELGRVGPCQAVRGRVTQCRAMSDRAGLRQTVLCHVGLSCRVRPGHVAPCRTASPCVGPRQPASGRAQPMCSGSGVPANLFSRKRHR